MIKCAECSRMFSPLAKACPDCGCPTMKCPHCEEIISRAEVICPVCCEEIAKAGEEDNPRIAESDQETQVPNDANRNTQSIIINNDIAPYPPKSRVLYIILAIFFGRTRHT